MKQQFTKALFIVISIFIFSSTIMSQSIRGREFLFFSSGEIERIKKVLAQENSSIKRILDKIKNESESLMKKGPWSVTFTPSPVASGNPHDYFSESSYWWPDPSDPNKPYIRRDGERNPKRFDTHRRDIEIMSQSVLALSVSSYFYNSTKYAERATHFIKVWFLDAATKMNPHMQYAQAIRNRSDGRGVGIIDSRSLVYVLEGINFLRAANFWNDELEKEIKNWFNEYLYWLINSKNGLDEKNQGNNHSTWWSVQVGAISDFLENQEILKMTFDFVKDELMEYQLEEDGTQPKEEARTNSLSYSFFNLDAYSMILRLAHLNGVNLWSHQNTKGGSVEKAVEYLFPFIKNPGSWTKQQISPIERFDRRFLAIAGLDLSNKKYLELSKIINKQNELEKPEPDPFVLLINMLVELQ